MRKSLLPFAAVVLPIALLFSSSAVGEDAAAVIPPGLGDPGKLNSIEIVTGREVDNFVTIRGREIAQQCIVLGHYETGQVRDLSRDVKWTTKPEGIATVSQSGYITSVAEGETVVVASILSDDELSTSIQAINDLEGRGVFQRPGSVIAL